MTKPPQQPADAVDAGEPSIHASRDSGGREQSERPKSHVSLPPLAPVALRMETLLTWVAQRTSRFPRDVKFTVGDRWLEACLDVQTALLDATYRPVRDPGKARALHEANRALTRARVLARLGARLGALTERQLLYFAGESDEVGRMMGGWLRQVSGRSGGVTS